MEDWSKGLQRRGVFFEGWVEDLDQVLESYRKATVTSYGTRRSSKAAACSNKENDESQNDSKMKVWALLLKMHTFNYFIVLCAYQSYVPPSFLMDRCGVLLVSWASRIFLYFRREERERFFSPSSSSHWKERKMRLARMTRGIIEAWPNGADPIVGIWYVSNMATFSMYAS